MNAVAPVSDKLDLRAARPMWRAAENILNLKGTDHG